MRPHFHILPHKYMSRVRDTATIVVATTIRPTLFLLLLFSYKLCYCCWMLSTLNEIITARMQHE